MSTEPVLLTEIDPAGFAVLTLNRPARLNALSRALLGALAEAVDTLDANPDVHVLIVTGAGRAFSAGLDLKEIGAGDAGFGNRDGIVRARDPVEAIERCRKPVIAAVNGVAVTGGFELALACDILLASSDAQFADTHARIGVAPGWGLSQRLARAIGPYRAREVSFTGNWVSADQACAWGFVNRVVSPDTLMACARRLAHDMLVNLPHMLTRYKAVINDGFATTLSDGLAMERARAREYNSGVAAADVEGRREGVRARNRETR